MDRPLSGTRRTGVVDRNVRTGQICLDRTDLSDGSTGGQHWTGGQLGKGQEEKRGTGWRASLSETEDLFLRGEFRLPCPAGKQGACRSRLADRASVRLVQVRQRCRGFGQICPGALARKSPRRRKIQILTGSRSSSRSWQLACFVLSRSVGTLPGVVTRRAGRHDCVGRSRSPGAGGRAASRSGRRSGSGAPLGSGPRG